MCIARAHAYTNALCPLAVETPQRSSEKPRRVIDTPQVDCPAPTQVILQIARGDTVEMAQPVFKATLIAVDVPEVNGAAHTGWRGGYSSR